jgi:hypothetical protein
VFAIHPTATNYGAVNAVKTLGVCIFVSVYCYHRSKFALVYQLRSVFVQFADDAHDYSDCCECDNDNFDLCVPCVLRSKVCRKKWSINGHHLKPCSRYLGPRLDALPSSANSFKREAPDRGSKSQQSPSGTSPTSPRRPALPPRPRNTSSTARSASRPNPIESKLSEPFQITIHCPDKKTLTVWVSGQDSVRSLKETLEQLEGYPAGAQKLYLSQGGPRSVRVSDHEGSTLSGQGVGENAKLSFVVY